MEISVKADFDDALRQLRLIGSEIVPKAAAAALNETAFGARRDVQEKMKQVFDRPTPWSLNAPWVEKARSNFLVVSVNLISESRGNGYAGAHTYLGPQIEGGPRQSKGLEKALRGIGMLYPDEFLVPSKFMKLDRYGNVPLGEYNKIRANLRTSRVDPYSHTPSHGARGGKKKAEYFWHRRGGGSYSRLGSQMTAIWKRTPAGNAVPAFIVVGSAPKYRKRLPFYDVLNRSVERNWRRNFEQQISVRLRRG